MHCGETHNVSAYTHHESWERGGQFDSGRTINGWCFNCLRMLLTSWNHKFTIHTRPSQKLGTTPLWWMMVAANAESSFGGKNDIFLVLIQFVCLCTWLQKISADIMQCKTLWPVTFHSKNDLMLKSHFYSCLGKRRYCHLCLQTWLSQSLFYTRKTSVCQ